MEGFIHLPPMRIMKNLPIYQTETSSLQLKVKKVLLRSLSLLFPAWNTLKPWVKVFHVSWARTCLWFVSKKWEISLFLWGIRII